MKIAHLNAAISLTQHEPSAELELKPAAGWEGVQWLERTRRLHVINGRYSRPANISKTEQIVAFQFDTVTILSFGGLPVPWNDFAR